MKLNMLAAVPVIALAAALSLAACGGSGHSSGRGGTLQNTAPAPAASVIRISQNSVNQEGGLAPVLHYINFYSNGHSTSCTGMPNQVTGSYDWMGDCVPDGK